MKREEIRWIPKKPECTGGQATFITVDLNVIEPAIILLLFGYALSIVMVLVERAHHKFANQFQYYTLVSCHNLMNASTR